MLETIALAFGLAMDATAMAAVRGLTAHGREAWLLPLLFGVFQSAMAAFGWAIGAWGGPYIEAWDHWIAFGLLVGIGLKMLIDAWRSRNNATTTVEPTPTSAGTIVLLGLAFATSIDAAAAGLTLPLLPVSPWLAIALIGVITVACSAAAFALGRRVGRMLGATVTVVGGVILIAIGIRILVQHVTIDTSPPPTTTTGPSAIIDHPTLPDADGTHR